VICPNCGLALPPVARFCARCGARLTTAAPAAPTAPAAPAPRPAAAPVWLLSLLWLGAAGLLWVAAVYLAIALGFVPPAALSGTDISSVQGPAALVAACAASLCLAHLTAVLGLMGGRTWARTFATLVCVVWALTCVLLPVGLLGISALWRPRRGPDGSATSRPSP
jgi:zinc-ribbon domain